MTLPMRQVVDRYNLACELHLKEVFLVGHDLYSNDDKVNNIYAGTKSYAEKDALAAYLIKQMRHIIGYYNIKILLTNLKMYNSIR